jgi:hypothetical protein
MMIPNTEVVRAAGAELESRLKTSASAIALLQLIISHPQVQVSTAAGPLSTLVCGKSRIRIFPINLHLRVVTISAPFPLIVAPLCRFDTWRASFCA